MVVCNRKETKREQIIRQSCSFGERHYTKDWQVRSRTDVFAE